MTFFVDTSALLAVLDADDENHQKARETWEDLISREAELVCSSYILVETFALVQNRLGIEAVRTFQEDVMPLVNTVWIDESMHQVGVTAVLTAARKNLSLVDCISFDVMRRLGIKSVFVFDPHFKEQGFECIL